MLFRASCRKTRLPSFGRAARMRSGRSGQCPQVLAIWWPRFLKAAEWAIWQEQAVRAGIEEVLAEIEGELIIESPAGPFRLTARADRLELHGDGSVVIVDYKTGQPAGEEGDEARHRAAAGARRRYLAGRRLLRGRGWSGDPLAELRFWQLSGNEKGGKVEARSTELVNEALEGLQALVRHYDQAGTAYPAAYRPPTARRAITIIWRGSANGPTDGHGGC